MSSRRFSNISAYRFVDLADEWIREQRPLIRREGVDRDIRGTILLTPEGTNVALSGRPDSVRGFWTYFTSLPPFRDMTFKESFSERITFNRMLVKIKKEIIAFGLGEIHPATQTSARVRPETLKEWLDEGRDIVLLDTRNDYEVALGSFQGSVQLNIDNFRSFPDAARQLGSDLLARRVVTFCTGGIRCEKAAPFLEELGFEDVHQLDGGILQYFEDCGGAHWNGECFVFDKRVAVDAHLEETDTEYCYRCQHILDLTDQQSSLYEEGVRCPYCA
jgi:predicted sulfurtransferase